MKKIIFLAILATAFYLNANTQTIGQYGNDSLGNCYQFGTNGWEKIPKKFIAVNMTGDTLGFFCTRSEAESMVSASNARIKQYLVQNKQTVQTSGNGSPTITVINSQKSNNQSSSEYEDYGYGGYTCNQCGQGYCDNHHRCGMYWFNGQYYYEGTGMYCTYYRDRGYVPNLMGQGTWCTWRRNSNGRGFGWFRSFEQQPCSNYQYTSQYGGYVPQPQGGCGRPPHNGCNDGGRVAGWEYGVRISQ